MYLDTDVILASIKDDDWLASEVDLASIDEPVTSTATTMEVQYVMQDEWPRERLAAAATDIDETGVELVPLTEEDVRAAGTLRDRYARVGVFDSVHLAGAWTRDVPIVSTDTLYPSIEEVEHIDPRELE